MKKPSDGDCQHNWREVSEGDTACPMCAAIATEAAACPDRIWLQIQSEEGEALDQYSEGRTWRQDRINESDVEYVRVDRPVPSPAADDLESRLRDEIARLRAIGKRLVDDAKFTDYGWLIDSDAVQDMDDAVNPRP